MMFRLCPLCRSEAASHETHYYHSTLLMILDRYFGVLIHAAGASNTLVSKFTTRTRNGTSAECLSQGDRIRGRGTESASGFGPGDRIRGGT